MTFGHGVSLMSLSETLPPAVPAGTGGVRPVRRTFCNAVAHVWAAALLGLAAVGIVGVLFASRFRELYAGWISDDNYSHGFLVPIVSAWLAWEVPAGTGRGKCGTIPGLFWVVTGCTLHLWADIVWWPPMDFLALVTLLYGFAVLAGGRPWVPTIPLPDPVPVLHVPVVASPPQSDRNRLAGPNRDRGHQGAADLRSRLRGGQQDLLARWTRRGRRAVQRTAADRRLRRTDSAGRRT